MPGLSSQAPSCRNGSLLLSKLWNRAEDEVVDSRTCEEVGCQIETDQTLTPEHVDHLLEQMWMAGEEGRTITTTPTGLLGRACCRFHNDAEGVHGGTCRIGHHLPSLLGQGLVAVDGEEVKLTKAGQERAELLIRRHRLAEMLLTQMLDLEVDCNQEDVCLLEHALSPRVTDRICAFLGHPPACQHGRVIPRGECCKRAKEVRPLVFPLVEARSGDNYRIVFIAPRHHARLDRLGVLGIAPGADIRLHQKMPSYVVRIAETDVAIDKEIAAEIYVRPA